MPRFPQLWGMALAGHRHSCSIFYTKSALGTYWNKMAVALPKVSLPPFLF